MIELDNFMLKMMKIRIFEKKGNFLLVKMKIQNHHRSEHSQSTKLNHEKLSLAFASVEILIALDF